MKVLAVAHAAPAGACPTRRLDLIRQLGQDSDVGVARVHPDGTLEALGTPALDRPPETRTQVNLHGEVVPLASWLLRERVQLIHALDDAAARWAIPAARKAGCVVLLSRHQAPLSLRIPEDFARAELTRAADAVVTGCAELRDRLARVEGISPEHTVVIAPGIDLTRWDARVHTSHHRGRSASPGSRPVVLSCNLDEPTQHLEEMLRGLALARRRHPELEAWVVGCGRRRAAHDALVNELLLEGAVRFCGERQDLPNLYAGALAACFGGEDGPSLVEALEPMASACPVLVPATSVAATLIGHYERGAAVAEHRPAALARALVALLDDPSHARALGREARAYLEREHDAQVWLSSMRALYGRLLAATPWAAPGGGGTYGHELNGPLPTALER